MKPLCIIFALLFSTGITGFDIKNAPSYTTEIKGHYTIKQLDIAFQGLTVHCRDSAARIVSTRAGITGLLVWGDIAVETVGAAGKSRVTGKGLFMRFHPSLFKRIKPSLRIIRQGAGAIECNNLYQVVWWRFFHTGPKYIIPPRGTVGISLSSADLADEKVFVLIKNKYKLQYQPETHTILKILKTGTVPVARSVFQMGRTIVRAWVAAMNSRRPEKVYPYLQVLSDGRLYLQDGLGFCSGTDISGIRIEANTISVRSPQVSRPVRIDEWTAQDLFLVRCYIKDRKGRPGRIRLLVALIGGKWKIVNYEMSM